MARAPLGASSAATITATTTSVVLGFATMPYTSSYDWRYTTTPRDYQSFMSVSGTEGGNARMGSYRVEAASFASFNAKRIGTSTQLSTAVPALRAGTKRQRRRTVSIAASPSTSKPDGPASSARCTIPSVPTGTRSV